eukprot:1268210-Alexandrium_andersonii.AAC.1
MGVCGCHALAGIDVIIIFIVVLGEVGVGLEPLVFLTHGDQLVDFLRAVAIEELALLEALSLRRRVLPN